MTIYVAALGGSDWANDDVLYAADLNDTFTRAARLLVGSIYTGTGYDTTSGGTATNTHSIALSAATLDGANYVVVNMNLQANCTASTSTSGTASTTVTVKRQETGSGAGFTTVTSNVVSGAGAVDNSGQNHTDRGGGAIRCIVTLTANEKTNGIDIELGSASTATTGTTSSVTNKQVWFEALY